MAHTQFDITAPVVNDPSGGDIQTVLGESSGDVEVLCKSSRIVIWARNKPFISTVKFVPTDTDRRNAHFGLAIPSLTSGSYFNKLAYECISKTMSYTTNLKGYWEYRRPYGGETSPYRMHDFDGYAAMSTFPVGISISGDGLVSKGNNEYEMNYNTSNIVKVTFLNITSPHIPLWELCQHSSSPLSTNPWRVRIGVFSDDGSTLWYNRATPETGTDIVSEPIPFVANGFTTFSVNVSFPYSFTQNTGKIYYLVIGFQRCNASGGGVSMSDIDNSYGFLPPFNQSSYNSQTFPFLWKFRLSNYFGRTIKITYGNSTLGYATSSWFTYTNGCFEARWQSGQLFIVCQISELPNTAAMFVNQNGTGGGSGTKIQFAAMCPAAHGETMYYATPSNSSRGSATDSDRTIPMGAVTSYKTLYMSIDGNIRPSSVPSGGGYYTIMLMSRSYTTSSPSGNWVNATSFTIHILN